MDIIARYEGCLLGLACGDALGAQVEFRARHSFETPRDLLGGGPFRLAPGEWTDDTSMALCLADSLLHCGGFDAVDQMNRYCRWMNDGYRSSNGRCFDIGVTTSSALRSYQIHGNPYAGSTEPTTAGNGSLMRLAPIALFFSDDPGAAVEFAALSSKTTHAATECLEACAIYVEHLIRALHGESKQQVLLPSQQQPTSPALQALACGGWQSKDMTAIASSGYVVHSLEAALWCVHQARDFEEAILQAISLGDDTDTTAAITGQLAGALFGVDAIPVRWRTKLVQYDEIRTLAGTLYRQRAQP